MTVNAPGPRDGGNWLLRYSPPANSPDRPWRWSSKTTDRAAAERQAREEAARLNAQLVPGTSPLLSSLVDLYLEHEGAELEDGTVRYYARARRAVAAAAPGARVADATPEVLAELRAALRAADGRPLRPSTANAYMSALRAAWTWARENPMRTGVTQPWVAPRQRRRKGAKIAAQSVKRPYSVPELAAVLAELRRVAQWPLFCLLADLGPRIEELCSADVSDLRRDDEGRDWLHLRSKTGARDVPITREALDLLAPGERGALFPSRRSGRASASAAFTALQLAIRRAGVDNTPTVVHGRPSYPLDLHSFRRSWIADSARAGVVREVSMLITGHELEGVHDRYGRGYVGDDLHAAVRRVRAWRDALVPGVTDPGRIPVAR